MAHINEGEHKAMGMAPSWTPRYVDNVWKRIECAADGSFRLNMEYFAFYRSTKNRESVKRGVRIANVILGTAGTVCIVASGYGVFRYLHDNRAFTGARGAALYVLISAMAACVLFACLWLEPSRRINVALMALSTGLALASGEAVLEYLTAPPRFVDYSIAAKKAGADFDARSRREVVEDLRQHGVDAYPTVYPGLLLAGPPGGPLKSDISVHGVEILPLAGRSNKVTVFCNELGDWLTYESDEFGFHNPKGIWGSAPIDVAAFGDSFTQGGCVRADKNFVALVRRRYPATLNLGMSGSGPLSMLATAKEYIKAIRPRAALWFYYEGNDLGDLRNEQRSPLLMRYLEPDFTRRLLSRQEEIDLAITNYVEAALAGDDSILARRPTEKGVIFSLGLLRVIKLTNTRIRLGLAFGRETNEAGEAEMHLFRDILLQAKALVTASGGTLYFVYLPEYQRHKIPLFASPARARVLAMVQTLGLPIIDIHLAFQAQKTPCRCFRFVSSATTTSRAIGSWPKRCSAR